MSNIIGWSHTPFGRHPHETLESLIVQAAQAAIADAGIDPADIDEVILGHFNAGFSPQDFTASLIHQAHPALRFKPATRVENACASGSAAVRQGLRAIRAGDAHVVLVVGAEKMTDSTGPEIAANLLRASYLTQEGATVGGFAGIFGQITGAYFDRFGDQSDALAEIAAKNHANGVANPFAQIRKDLGYAFCREESDRNPIVAGPLKRTDCSLVSDGAAALVLANDEISRSARRAVRFRANVHVQDVLPMSAKDITRLNGASRAWNTALAQAALTLDDLSFVETHDCFTIAELMEYEAMGLAEPGQGWRLLKDGSVHMGGRLPVNPSGGLKAKGHPIGATGVSMHVVSAMQLTQEAPTDMQVRDAQIAGVFNMGGAGVANYVSLLERAS
ncbi:MAG: acetyl-CoA acetyltransferase [Proteobacteria bacterium]|nr:acetyl-CoA acetyltransferase [Pseudomonadota bacterium]